MELVRQTKNVINGINLDELQPLAQITPNSMDTYELVPYVVRHYPELKLPAIRMMNVTELRHLINNKQEKLEKTPALQS